MDQPAGENVAKLVFMKISKMLGPVAGNLMLINALEVEAF